MEPERNRLFAVLETCERGVWDALVRGDKEADACALHDTFLGVYSDGFATKSDHVQQLDHGPSIKSFNLSEQRVLPLGPDCAVFSYKADFIRTGRDVTESMYVSSIWQLFDGDWRNVFSQDTPALDRP